MSTRRNFIKQSGTALLAVHSGFAGQLLPHEARVSELNAHLWVYASRFPPDWDCTPILDEVFGDLKYAGYDGVEIMEPILRRANAVDFLQSLQKKHGVRLSGTSYSGNMWDKKEHAKIEDDVELVTKRLQEAGGKTFGISVGDARRKKTEEELDAQAELLQKILKICNQRGIEANLHNHTYEMQYEMADFKGTITRVPELKLGPDLNWLIRAKVDPVSFIRQYGDRMVYMHLRDQDAAGKWTEAVGEGSTDFPAIARALQEINYKRRAAVELAFEWGVEPKRPVRESWKMSRDYVRKVFGW